MSLDSRRVIWACAGAGFVPAAIFFLLCRYAPNPEYREWPHVVFVPLFFWGLSALLGATASVFPLVREVVRESQK